MDQKTAELLQHLADRVGSTAEKLWAQFVHYVFIDAITGLIFSGLVLLALPFLGRALWRWGDREHATEIKVVSGLIVGTAGLIFLVIFFCNLVPALDPEGAAVAKVLATVK